MVEVKVLVIRGNVAVVERDGITYECFAEDLENRNGAYYILRTKLYVLV